MSPAPPGRAVGVPATVASCIEPGSRTITVRVNLKKKPMTVIELPDEQAAALKAKAAAAGLTLEAWLIHFAGGEPGPPGEYKPQ